MCRPVLPVELTTDEAASLLTGKVVDIGGIAVEFRAQSLNWARAMQTLTNQPRHPGPPLLTLLFGRDIVPEPSTPPDEVLEELRIWRSKDEFVLDWQGEVRVQASRSSIAIDVVTPEQLPIIHNLFPLALAHALAHHDRLVLRGGAIARGGKSLMILGRAGAGKSSTVLTAAAHGWQAQSDDSVVLSREGRIICITGIPKEFHVPADLIRKGDRARPVSGDPRKRWILEDFEWSHQTYELAATLVVTHGHDSLDDPIPMPPRKLVKMVEESFSANLLSVVDKTAFKKVKAIAARTSRVPAWELRLPAEPSTRTAEVGRMLEQIASRFLLGGG